MLYDFYFLKLKLKRLPVKFFVLYCFREQGRALGQALLEAGYLESVAMETTDFSDGYTLYRLRSSPHSPSPTIPQHLPQQLTQHSQQLKTHDIQNEETLWLPQTQHQDSTTTGHYTLLFFL